jgi:hypothetical protein
MELNHYFVEHNIPERMDRLSRNDLLAETLYQDITNCGNILYWLMTDMIE